MKVRFASALNDSEGNAYGYSRMKKEFFRGLLDGGVEFTDDADLVLHMCPPGELFIPHAGKTNVLFTMWESEVLDDGLADSLRRADAVLTPSTWCRDVFRKYTDAPIRVVPLGVDTDVFTYHERTDPRPDNRPWVWMWCGAPNARKGYDVIGKVWNDCFGGCRDMFLYMKTTGCERDGMQQEGNVIFDFRNVPQQDLVHMYQAAHGFVFPTAGEGWGLTLMEAMATGCPCIATSYSGLRDFANHDNAALVNFDMVDTDNGRGTVPTALARPADVALKMIEFMDRPGWSFRIGKKASRDMRRFTWARAVTCLRSELERLG